LILGYFGGWLDVVATRILDVLQSVPLLIMALAILAATQGSALVVALVIAFVYTPVLTRVVRAETIALKSTPFVEAAIALGNGDVRIMYRHILPATAGPLVVQAAVRLAFAIKVTAALAFVGVGILPPTPEWGSMIRVGTDDLLRGLWWTSFFPGLAVTILVLAFTVLADGLQASFNPKTRR
jgi:peptide/nickel transport system permease protein